MLTTDDRGPGIQFPAFLLEIRRFSPPGLYQSESTCSMSRRWESRDFRTRCDEFLFIDL